MKKYYSKRVIFISFFLLPLGSLMAQYLSPVFQQDNVYDSKAINQVISEVTETKEGRILLTFHNAKGEGLR